MNNLWGIFFFSLYRVFRLYSMTPGQSVDDCLKYPKMSKSKTIRFSFKLFLREKNLRRREMVQTEVPAAGLGVAAVPWRRERLPTPVFLLGESHGQRSLAG